MQPNNNQIQYILSNLQNQRDQGREFTNLRRLKDSAKNASAFRGLNNIQARIRIILNLPELTATCTLVGSNVLLTPQEN